MNNNISLLLRILKSLISFIWSLKYKRENHAQSLKNIIVTFRVNQLLEYFLLFTSTTGTSS